MSRKSRYTPEQLLDLARAAISVAPDTRAPDFRAAHNIGMNEAQAVLTAARWEAGHRPYSQRALSDLPPRYQELVKPPEPVDTTQELDLAALPDVLRAPVDHALDSTRAALGRVIESLRSRARRLIAEAEERAVASIRAAEMQAQEIAGSLDAAERQAAEAREETARVRAELNGEVARLTQELKDERRERAAAEHAFRRADEERLRALDSLDTERAAARATTTDLTQRLVEAQRLAGAAERELKAMEVTVADTRRRLDEATQAASRALREGAGAEARAVLLEETHAAELRRLRESHADEVARLGLRRSNRASHGRNSSS